MNDSDPFDEISKLLRSSRRNIVLSMLLNAETGRIKKPYISDLNHAWYIVGSILYKQQCAYTGALSAFKKSYRHWKGDVAAIRAIGNCYSDLGNPKMAKYYFEKARTVGGKKYKDIDIVTYNLGNAYFDMGKYRDAVKQYKKVGKRDKRLFKLACSNIKKAEKLAKKK